MLVKVPYKLKRAGEEVMLIVFLVNVASQNGQVVAPHRLFQ